MAKKQRKLPFMKWYWGDWNKDTGVKALNYHRRGVWHAMLGLMFESSRRGYLVLNGEAYPTDLLATALNLPESEVVELIALFKKIGLCSVEESSGAIFNRRMVEDAKKEAQMVYPNDFTGDRGDAGGDEGGEQGVKHSQIPDYKIPGYLFAFKRKSDGCVKIALSLNPTKRFFNIKKDSPNEELVFLESFAVDNMADAKEVMYGVYDSINKNNWLKMNAKQAKDPFSPLRGTGVVTGVGTPVVTGGMTTPPRSQKSEVRRREEEEATAAEIEIPADWQISDDLRKWVEKNAPNLGADLCALDFKTHFENPSANNRLRRDWDAEFKRWMVRELKNPKPDNITGNGIDTKPQTYMGVPIGEIG